MKTNTIKKKWIGMNYQEWCKLDETDNRKINYTLTYTHAMQSVTEQFTSNDIMDGIYLNRLQRSSIDKIELINSEWYITLSD